MGDEAEVHSFFFLSAANNQQRISIHPSILAGKDIFWSVVVGGKAISTEFV